MPRSIIQQKSKQKSKQKKKTDKYKLPYVLTSKSLRDEFLYLLEEKGLEGDDVVLALHLCAWDLIGGAFKEATFACSWQFRKSIAPQSSLRRLVEAGLIDLYDYSQEEHKCYTGRFTNEVRRRLGNPDFAREVFEQEDGKAKLVDFITGKRMDGRKALRSSTYDENGNSYPQAVASRIKALKQPVSWDMKAAFALYEYRYAEATTEEEISRCVQVYSSLMSILRCKGVWQGGLWVCEGAYEMQSHAGRLTALGGGFVALPRDYQAVLVRESGFINYDLEKCHDMFTLDDAKRLGISMPNVQRYVDDKSMRAEMAKKAGISIDDLKMLMLQQKYGGDLPSPESVFSRLFNDVPLEKLDAPIRVAKQEGQKYAKTLEAPKSQQIGYWGIYGDMGDMGGIYWDRGGRSGEEKGDGEEGEERKGEMGGGVYSLQKYYIENSLHLFIFSLFSYFFRGKSPSFSPPTAHLESTLFSLKKYTQIYEVLKPFHAEYTPLHKTLYNEAVEQAKQYISNHPEDTKNHGIIRNAVGVPLQVLKKNRKGNWTAISYYQLKSQVPSHRYQGQESQVMGLITIELEKLGIITTASCHDGIVTDRHIPQDVLEGIRRQFPELPSHNLIVKPLDVPEEYEAALEAYRPQSTSIEVDGETLADREEYVDLFAVSQNPLLNKACILGEDFEILPFSSDRDNLTIKNCPF